MSYSIYFLSEADGEAERRRAVLNLLSKRGLIADEYGWINVATEDGGTMSLSVRDDELQSFLGTEAVWFSRQLAELVFDISRQGYDVLGDNGEHILTTDPDRVANGPDLATVLCMTPEELYLRINEPFEDWADFRDQVISDFDRGFVPRTLGRLLGR